MKLTFNVDVFVWFLPCTEAEYILVYLDLIQPGMKIRRHLMSWIYGQQILIRSPTFHIFICVENQALKQ